MQSDNRNGSRASPPRRFVFWAVLSMGLVLATSPAAAAPFAYVLNQGDGTISVIDTATNTVLSGTGLPIPVEGPAAVVIAPDGKRVYVTNAVSNNVSVIDTATNTVLTGMGFAIPVGQFPLGIAITPDGKRAYVVNSECPLFMCKKPGTVSVIDTATNTVLTGTGFPIPVGSSPLV